MFRIRYDGGNWSGLERSCVISLGVRHKVVGCAEDTWLYYTQEDCLSVLTEMKTRISRLSVVPADDLDEWFLRRKNESVLGKES